MNNTNTNINKDIFYLVRSHPTNDASDHTPVEFRFNSEEEARACFIETQKSVKHNSYYRINMTKHMRQAGGTYKIESRMAYYRPKSQSKKGGKG